VVVLSEHLVRRLARQGLSGLVEQQVTPLQILGKNAVGRTVGDGVQQTERLQPASLLLMLAPSGLGDPEQHAVHQAIKQQRSDRHEKPALEGLQPHVRRTLNRQPFDDPVGEHDPQGGEDRVGQNDTPHSTSDHGSIGVCGDFGHIDIHFGHPRLHGQTRFSVPASGSSHPGEHNRAGLIKDRISADRRGNDGRSQQNRRIRQGRHRQYRDRNAPLFPPRSAHRHPKKASRACTPAA